MAVIFVDNGTEVFSDFILAAVGASVTASGFFMGWGTGGSGTLGTATNTDVDLRAEATEARVSCTGETQSAADTNQFIGRLTKTDNASTIEEFGFFMGTGTATAMIIHANHGAVALATEDVIEYTLTIQMV